MVTQNIFATLRFFVNMFFLLGTMVCVLVIVLFATILCEPNNKREVVPLVDLAK